MRNFLASVVLDFFISSLSISAVTRSRVMVIDRSCCCADGSASVHLLADDAPDVLGS